MAQKRNEGGICPKCKCGKLVKHRSKSETVDWYLKCDDCNVVFFVEAGKARAENKPSYTITLAAKKLADDNEDKLSPEYYIQAILNYLDEK